MSDFLIFALVGFLAQIVDGALGMAFGIIAASALMAFGAGPAQASAAVHVAKIFTGIASALAHARHGNISRSLFWRLALAGTAGGLTGTLLVTAFDGRQLKPWIAAYLLAVGIWLVLRSLGQVPKFAARKKLAGPLGLAGGFLDAIGGGGWGPVVTTGLLGAGAPPRFVIGSVNAAECVVALAVTAGFAAAWGSGHWQIETSAGLAAIAGLICGGVLAAPLAGYAVKVLSRETLMRGVGVLIVGLSLLQIML